MKFVKLTAVNLLIIEPVPILNKEKLVSGKSLKLRSKVKAFKSIAQKHQSLISML